MNHFGIFCTECIHIQLCYLWCYTFYKEIACFTMEFTLPWGTMVWQELSLRKSTVPATPSTAPFYSIVLQYTTTVPEMSISVGNQNNNNTINTETSVYEKIHSFGYLISIKRVINKALVLQRKTKSFVSDVPNNCVKLPHWHSDVWWLEDCRMDLCIHILVHKIF